MVGFEIVLYSLDDRTNILVHFRSSILISAT